MLRLPSGSSFQSVALLAAEQAHNEACGLQQRCSCWPSRLEGLMLQQWLMLQSTLSLLLCPFSPSSGRGSARALNSQKCPRRAFSSSAALLRVRWDWQKGLASVSPLRERPCETTFSPWCVWCRELGNTGGRWFPTLEGHSWCGAFCFVAIPIEISLTSIWSVPDPVCNQWRNFCNHSLKRWQPWWHAVNYRWSAMHSVIFKCTCRETTW